MANTMNIVYYKIEDSPFFLRVNDFMFYFSSRFLLSKFERGYKEYLRNETLKLNLKYKMIVCADEMLLLSFYKMVEKRGFKVQYKGVELDKDYYIDCILNKEYSETVKE